LGIFRPFLIPNEDKALHDGFKDLKVAGLYDYKNNPDDNKHRSLITRSENIVLTQFGKRCPTIVSMIEDIIDQPDRCWISYLAPGRTVPFHSHYTHQFKKNKDHFYNHMVLHIPLLTNSRCMMGVRNDDPDKFNSNAPVDWQHYEAGGAWILNSWRPHAATNYSSLERIHIFCNFHLINKGQINVSNRKIMSHLEQILSTT
jgi:hypothetical protein